jgi:nucleotide-binding universal stress UspA family protein
MNEFVVGVDGSDHSRMALQWAVATAGPLGVSVRAAQSWMHPAAAAFPMGPDPMPLEDMDEHILRGIVTIVADACGAKARVTPTVLRGPPAGALVEAVTPDSVLVLGSRGLGGFTGLVLGSVSQECVEYASCPVIVVRTDRMLREGETILVGSDGSDGAHRALTWAHALAGATGARVHAVHAWRATVSERPPRLGDRLESRAADAVQSWTEQVSNEIESDEVEGDPREVLVAAAERLDPALTVVGRRGAGGFRSMRLGSTANHLVRNGPSNVAVVPAPDDDQSD